MQNHIFISYSRVDKVWLDRLNIFLKPLGRNQNIVSWDDTSIKPAGLWREEIATALNQARVAILLISANFFASDFIQNIELPTLLRAAENSGTKIMPVIVGASRFNREPGINQFQAVNDPTQPLESLLKYEADNILLKVANTVEDLFMEPQNLEYDLRNCNNLLVDGKILDVEITIDEDFNSYNDEKKARLLEVIKGILDLKGDIKVKHIRRGSIKLTIELSPEKAEELVWAIKSGRLEDYNVVDAEIREAKIDTDDSLHRTFHLFKEIQQLGIVDGIVFEEAIFRDPQSSIQRNQVICLECGKAFKLLSNRHLALHGLTSREYKQKHGIRMTQTLCARTLSARQRKLAKDLGRGKQLAAWRAEKKRRGD